MSSKWTYEEDAQLRKLWTGCASQEELSKALNRSAAAIYERAKKLQLPAIPDPAGVPLKAVAVMLKQHPTVLMKWLRRWAPGLLLRYPGLPVASKSRWVFPDDVLSRVGENGKMEDLERKTTYKQRFEETFVTRSMGVDAAHAWLLDKEQSLTSTQHVRSTRVDVMRLGPDQWRAYAWMTVVEF